MKSMRFLMFRIALIFAASLLAVGAASATSAPASTPSTGTPIAVPLVDAASINADTVRDAMRKCIASRDPVFRVQCYDAYASSLGIVATSQLEKQDQSIAHFGLWTLSHKIDPLGQMVMYLRLPMDQPILVDGVAKVYPDLVFSCKRNQTDAYIDLKIRADVKRVADMNFSFDSARVFAEDWAPSGDGEALFAPNPVAFAQMTYVSKTLSMSFATQSGSNMTMSFALDQSAQALDALAHACYKPAGT